MTQCSLVEQDMLHQSQTRLSKPSLVHVTNGDPLNNYVNENITVSESDDQMILRLEAKLLATNIELQAEINERNALQNQVNILMTEIDSFKKDWQKSEKWNQETN